MLAQKRVRVHACKLCDLGDESARGADSDGNRARKFLAKGALQISRRLTRDFRIKHDVEISLAKARNIGGIGAKRRHHVDVHADLLKQLQHFHKIVAMTKAQGGRA